MIIYKHQLKEKTKQEILIPKQARIISVKDQLGVTCLWYTCSTGVENVSRIIYIFMTGQAFDEDINKLSFIGTVITADNFVLHIFEEKL